MKFLLLLFTAAISPALAHADEDGMKKYADYTPKQLLTLSEEERRSSVPIAYNQAANTEAHPAGATLFAAMLAKLAYPGIADFDRAVRMFQDDIGRKSTGALTVADLHALNTRARYQGISEVDVFGLAPNLFSFLDDDYAKVEGTVTILGERIAHPVNRVTIECFKGQRYCSYRHQALDFPNATGWTLSFHYRDFGETEYKVTEWTDTTIRASPLNQGGCRLNTLDLNFQNKEFLEITRNNMGNCELALGGEALPKLEKPRISQIVDGQSIARKEFADITAYSCLSSAYRKNIEALMDPDND